MMNDVCGHVRVLVTAVFGCLMQPFNLFIQGEEGEEGEEDAESDIVFSAEPEELEEEEVLDALELVEEGQCLFLFFVRLSPLYIRFSILELKQHR